jgi:hypothetical protein
MNHNLQVAKAPSPCDDAKLREIFAGQSERTASDSTASTTLSEFPLVAPGPIIPSSIDLTGWGLFLRVPSLKAGGPGADQSCSDGGNQ